VARAEETVAPEIAEFTQALAAELVVIDAEPLLHVPGPDVIVAAHERLGADGVARLRARYAEVVSRIAERIPDPARRDELKAQADRLSPDTWLTDDDVTQALEQYEAVFAALREVVGRKRRRRRRGSRSSEAEGDTPSQGETMSADPGPGEDATGEPSGQTGDPASQTGEAADASERREEPEDTGL
jgi:hypothetical protein